MSQQPEFNDDLIQTFIKFDSQKEIYHDLAGEFERIMFIPKTILYRQILKELYFDQLGYFNEYYSFRKLFIKTIVICFSGFLGFFCFYKKKRSYEILFEEFFLDEKKQLKTNFYSGIISKLGYYKFEIIHSPWNRKYFANVNGINRRLSSMYIRPAFFFRIVYFLIIFSRKLSLKNYFILLLILKKVSNYENLFRKISSEILISAGNYYWDPIKFHTAKKYINNILLIQKNSFLGFNENNFMIDSDKFYFENQESLEKSIYIKSRSKKIVGSFQSAAIHHGTNTENDILFIHHPVLSAPSYDSFSAKQQSNFDLMVDHLIKFSQLNPNIRILYSGKEDLDRQWDFDFRTNQFKNSGIKCIQTTGCDTQQLIANSHTIFNFWSSLGSSAYQLNRRVIWVNIDNSLDAISPGRRGDIDTLSSTDYSVFEKTLLKSLDPQDSDFLACTNKRRATYASSSSPVSILLHDIQLLLNDRGSS